MIIAIILLCNFYMSIYDANLTCVFNEDNKLACHAQDIGVVGETC